MAPEPNDTASRHEDPWVERYLAHLGVERAEPGLEALTALIRAHKLRVPFTNVTAIVRRAAHPNGPVPPIDFEALLGAWEQGRGGGVCFELAEAFYRLLTALGYNATRLFGVVRNPGDHQAVLVEMDGRRYLADVGSGMPVLAPVPLAGNVDMTHAGAQMRWRPAKSADELLQERVVDEDWQTVFRYDLAGSHLEEVGEAYQRHHTPGYNFVVTNMVVVRCTEKALYQLRGDTFTVTTQAGSTTSPVPDAAEAVRLVRDVIGLPGLPIAECMSVLAALRVPA